jgi:hypothetical protein
MERHVFSTSLAVTRGALVTRFMGMIMVPPRGVRTGLR